MDLYNDRKKRGVEWPGEMANAKDFVLPSLREMTPDFMHVMERERLASLFEFAGFQVVYCDYYSRRGLPELCRLDGRENLGMIAVRPR